MGIRWKFPFSRGSLCVLLFMSWFLTLFLILKLIYIGNTCYYDTEDLHYMVYSLREDVRQCRSCGIKSSQVLPIIYIVTPTYTRPVQKAELTRLCHTFSLVPFIHWIVVEDRESVSLLVHELLQNCGVPFTHLNRRTPENLRLQNQEPRWKKSRGVDQRNAGIAWLRRNRKAAKDGVVYFADDDNTYDLALFREMRWTKSVSVWPVGLVGGLMIERPRVDTDGKVSGWLVDWQPERPYALDMAGFAVSLPLLLSIEDAEFSRDAPLGYVESSLLSRLPITLKDLHPMAANCTKVYVWHTRTQKPDLRREEVLKLKGRSSYHGIEV